MGIIATWQTGYPCVLVVAIDVARIVLLRFAEGLFCLRSLSIFVEVDAPVEIRLCKLGVELGR